MKRIWNVGFVLLITLIKIRIYINIVNVVIIVEILTFADQFDDRALIMWCCVVAFNYRGLHHSHDLSRVPAIRIIRNSYDDEWFSTNACSTVYSTSTCHPLFYFQPRVKRVIAWNSKRLFFEQEKRKGRKNDGEKTKYEARRSHVEERREYSVRTHGGNVEPRVIFHWILKIFYRTVILVGHLVVTIPRWSL